MKTTKQDFAYFVKRCLHYRKKYGLTEWRVHFEHGDFDTRNKAGCLFSWSLKATINLERDWADNEVSHKELDHAAQHEILELLLAKMHMAAEDRFVAKGDLAVYVHEVVHRLQGVE